LVQAALASPLFTNRWRWNATRSLALLRHEGGRRVPMPLQRMRAEDLLAAVFPEQAACADNIVGPITVPEHPLVRETIDNCLHEAMDLDGLAEVLACIGRGEVATHAVDTAAPSPMSHEILNSNPYTYLDDAPLEERRARAGAVPGLRAGLDGPGAEPGREEALHALLGGWLECVGPTTAEGLAARIGVSPSAVAIGLAGLERSGIALRGRFTPDACEEEWCERRLLARIHRLTLGRLRREIEPVSAADLMPLLFRWQHVQPGTQLHGRDGLLEVIGQLQGLELPARAWETQVLP